MSKVMLINVANREEHRIAILSDGLLEEVSIETARYERIEGNIYKARVVKVIASLDAVFVDYGASRNGFLPIQDIHPQYLSGGKRSVEALKKGQELMVQVRKGELGQKGAALTTYISLPGRYFVLMPSIDKRGVSRKIDDEKTRKQLRQVLDSTGIPEEMGYIARTAAEGRTKQELTRDAGYLLRLWRRIEKDFEAAPGPAPLYQESGIVIRTIRDYFTPSIVEVWVDDGDVFEQVRSFFQTVMPWYTKRLHRFEKKSPLFSKYNLEEQIETIYDKTVRLPAGGSIVIEQTEALVSIDVNSGAGKKGKDIEETALITNREAAREVARQLRLRDLGGLIVIDFIDMRAASKRTEVKKVLQQALKEDKARTDVGSISKFGMLELSRQRLKPAATKGVTTPCDRCGGTGQVRSPESFALGVLRMVQAEMARGRADEARIGVASDIATLLLNRKRDKIRAFETDFNAEISVFPEPTLAPNQYYIEYRNGEETRTDTNLHRDAPRGGLRTPLGLPDVPTDAVRLTIYTLDDDEGEIPDVPIEPPEESRSAADDDSASPEQAQGETPSKKRRRRRRRRKKKTDEVSPAGEALEAERPAEADTDSAVVAQDANRETGDLAVDGEDGTAEGEEPPKKKRRRRRRRRKKKPAEGETSSGETVDDSTGLSTGAEPAEPPAGDTPPGDTGAAEPPPETPPARPRPRRRKKAAPAEDSTAEVPAGGGPDPTPASETPRRRKRSSRDEATETSTGTVTVVEETGVGEEPLPANKPRRRTRKPGPKKTGEDTAAASDTPVEPTPEKPKRRTPRARAKPADNPAEGEAPPPKKTRKRASGKMQDDKSAPGAPEEGTPAPKPRRRRTAAKSAPNNSADRGSAPDAGSAAEPAKKPRRKRAPKPTPPEEET